MSNGEIITSVINGFTAAAAGVTVGAIVKKKAYDTMNVKEFEASTDRGERNLAKGMKLYASTAALGTGVAIGWASLLGLDCITESVKSISKAVLKA